MDLRVNGAYVSADYEIISLEEFLHTRGVSAATPGVAVALNGEIARKAEWPTLFLKNGDDIEIVTARQGG